MEAVVTNKINKVLEIQIKNETELEDLIELFKTKNTDIKFFRIQKMLEDAR
jgi:molybdenum cofactor biosynthesis enzyme MoaA